VLVADHPGAFRSGVSSCLVEDAQYDVVEVEDADGLVAAGQSGDIDVILLDSGLAQSMHLEDIVEAIHAPAPSVIVWGFDDDAEVVVAALRAGADGYLDKDISATALRRAVAAAVRGEVVLPRRAIGAILGRLRAADDRGHAREMILDLSPREREVTALLGSGASNRAIAGALHISEYTVKRHVQNILRKLDLPSRKAVGALQRFAMDDGRSEEAPALGPGDGNVVVLHPV
jgi:two-component system nitrate/nitrite response regulator NarL